MQITRHYNPLALNHDVVALAAPSDAVSPNQIIAANALCFSGPVICMVNGDIWGRSDWDCIVPNDAHVRFVELPRGRRAAAIVGAVIITIAATATTVAGGALGWGAWAAAAGAAVSITGSLMLALLLPPISDESEGETDTAYSLNGYNTLRVDGSYAERFGRRKFYPDLAMPACVRRTGAAQYGKAQVLYSLMIIGVGEYDIEGIYVDETIIDDYEEVDYNILAPGTKPSLCKEILYPVDEVSSIALAHDEWATYVANPRGTTISKIEFEIEFPSGLVGHLSFISECRTIDNSGVATSGWVGLKTHHFGEQAITRSFGQRFCIAAPLGNARYEFRIRRVDPETSDLDNSEKAYLGALRGIAAAYHPAVTGVTMLEVVVKASSQLSGDVANKINVVATRKLYPVTSTGLGSTLTTTRSIIDAVVYMVTSTNGGQQDASIIMWDELYTLRTLFESEGFYFDWSYNSRSSVMDAVAKAARCGMALPCTPGGMFTLAADREQSGVSMVFSAATSIDKGSLKITHNFKTPDAYDSVRVKYTDTENWTEYYVDIGDGTENPYEITYEGCSSREHAYRYGLRIWNELQLTVTNVEWQTGLLGHLPSLFSWVGVGEESIDWGQTGVIAGVESGVIWLSEPVDFKGETTGWLLVQDPDILPGPYPVTPADTAHKVYGTIAGLLTIKDNHVNATPYIFGPSSEDIHVVRITAITPNGANSITLTGDVVNSDVYDTSGDPPDPGSGIEIDALVAVSLGASEIGATSLTMQGSWCGSADSFRVEGQSGAGSFIILLDETSLYTTTWESLLENVAMRVTPYVNGVLQTADAMIAYYTYEPSVLLDAPTNFHLQQLLAAAVVLTWDVVDGATGYKVYMGSTFDFDFDPKTEGTLKYVGTGNGATINVSLVDPYDYYFKVAATNVLYKDVDEIVFSPSLHVGTTGGTVVDNSGALVLTSTGDFIYS